MCNENKEISLEDGSTVVILTPDGCAKDVSEELLDFLEYLTGKEGSSPFVKRLEEAVDKARSRKEWRLEYLTLNMKYQEKFEEGKEEGFAEGLAKGRKSAIRNLLMKEVSDEFILSLEYTEEELLEVKQELATVQM